MTIAVHSDVDMSIFTQIIVIDTLAERLNYDYTSQIILTLSMLGKNFSR